MLSKPLLAFVSSLVLAVVTGCGETGTRRTVTGTVTRNGKPLASGAVTFLTGSPPKPAGGAMVRDGRFEMPADHGLEPGSYRVAISAPVPGGVLTREEKAAGASAKARESLPAKYNTETTLTAEVTADGANHFDFPLD